MPEADAMQSKFTNPGIADTEASRQVPPPPPPDPQPLGAPSVYRRLRFVVVRKVDQGGQLGVTSSITLRPVDPDNSGDNDMVWGARRPAGHLVLHGILPEVAAQYRANQLVTIDLKDLT